VDWNNDGLKDLLVGDYSGHVSYFRNVGSLGNPILTFDSYISVNGSPLQVDTDATPWVNDWNEDGLKDLLVGSADGRIRLYINEGSDATPFFYTTGFVVLASGDTLDAGSRSSPVVVDLDGDGAKDLISGNINGVPLYFRNTGNNEDPRLDPGDSLWVGEIPLNPSATSRFAPVDWNGDGLIDMIGGSYDSRCKLYLQTDVTFPRPEISTVNTGSWLVPSSGGTVEFNVEISNNQSIPLTFDVWSEVYLPDGSYYGPLFSRSNVTLPPGQNLIRDMTQNVPGNAMDGAYFYKVYAGNFSVLQFMDESEFYFHKMDTSSGNWIGNWDLTGWKVSGDKEENLFHQEADQSNAIDVSPNPFNATVEIKLTLPEATNLELSIYNLAGKQCANLCAGYLTSGMHIFNWNAASYSSGIYFVQLESKELEIQKKIVLLK